ncbi:MAG: class I SAM-dependent methyltransferase [Opitutus sp.]
MSILASHDYDRVAYPTMAHPQTFAEALAVKGFMRGLDVAPPGRCRVLELGCGDGFNLAAMAVSHPGATYTGIDYSAEAIARGRILTRELGLGQVRLEAADIRKLDRLEPALGEFDYIIAHGVYSWVPAEVRDALLTAIGQRLEPQGVAFVSYLALPGAYQREAVRSMIRFHTQAIKDPSEQIRQSRALLGIIARGSQEPTHYTQWIADELELIEKHSDEGFFHDELSAESAPVLFTEFLGHAAQYKLQFLCEAEYLLPVSQALTDKARDDLRPLEGNRVLLEQYLDFIEGRRFRQTLLCRPGLGEKLEAERLDQIWVSCRSTPASSTASLSDDAPIEFHGLRNSRIRASQPFEKAALLALTQQPGEAMPFPTLVAATRAHLQREGITNDSDFEPALRQYLCRGCLPGLIEFSLSSQPHTLSVPDRPCAHPLARWLLDRDAPSVISYTGRFVEVNGALGRQLLSLLDGTRDHDALAAAIRAFLTERQAAARAEGEDAKLPAPDDPTIPEHLKRSLKGLAALGLFRAD